MALEPQPQARVKSKENKREILPFLDAPSHLYKRVCPSVRPSVGPSVRPQ